MNTTTFDPSALAIALDAMRPAATPSDARWSRTSGQNGGADFDVHLERATQNEPDAAPTRPPAAASSSPASNARETTPSRSGERDRDASEAAQTEIAPPLAESTAEAPEEEAHEERPAAAEKERSPQPKRSGKSGAKNGEAIRNARQRGPRDTAADEAQTHDAPPAAIEAELEPPPIEETGALGERIAEAVAAKSEVAASPSAAVVDLVAPTTAIDIPPVANADAKTDVGGVASNEPPNGRRASRPSSPIGQTSKEQLETPSPDAEQEAPRRRVSSRLESPTTSDRLAGVKPGEGRRGKESARTGRGNGAQETAPPNDAPTPLTQTTVVEPAIPPSIVPVASTNERPSQSLAGQDAPRPTSPPTAFDATAARKSEAAAPGHTATSAISGKHDFERARFVQRVAKAMHAANERGGPLRLRLSPPELGALQLELRVRDGVMTARVTAETEAARTLLLDSLPDLRDRLALQDVRLERFDVDLRDSGQGRTPDRQAGTSGDRDRQQQPTRRTHAADAAAPAESARPAPLASSSAARLDVLI